MNRKDNVEELLASHQRQAVMNQDLQTATARLMEENEGMRNAFDVFLERMKRLKEQKRKLRATAGREARNFQVMLGEVLKINEELYQRANFDHLTGLQNRDGFKELVKAYHEQGVRHGVFFSLDIDKFKSINDSFGHGGGDQVLKKAAGVLSEVFRASDPISRISRSEELSEAETTTAGRRGGEEIIVFLPTANIKNALSRMREKGFAVDIKSDNNGFFVSIEISFDFSDQRIEEERLRKFDIPNERRNKITFSGSIREVNMPDDLSDAGKFVDEIVNEGEQDLYSAKAGGRNKVYLRGENLESLYQDLNS